MDMKIGPERKIGFQREELTEQSDHGWNILPSGIANHHAIVYCKSYAIF